MAEYHVNNSEDFIEKASTLTVNDTIILDNDIDLNYRTGAITVKCNIDGKGHSIYNIQSENNGIQTEGNTTPPLTINNVSFKNLLSLSQTGNFMVAIGSSAGATFENCQFQGKWGLLAGRNATFRKCYFELSVISKLYFAQNTAFYHCYINVIDFSVTSGSSSLFGSILDNCYIKGKINISYGSHTLSNNSYNSVFNFDLTTTSSSVGCYQATPNTINIYNSDKMSVTTVSPYMVACTDAEMHNAQAIADKGFPIVVG